MLGKVCLLAILGEGPNKRLYHYTALIPCHFLDRLDQPSRQYPSSLVRITYFRIPLKPAERLLQAMHILLSPLDCDGVNQEQLPKEPENRLPEGIDANGVKSERADQIMLAPGAKEN